MLMEIASSIMEILKRWGFQSVTECQTLNSDVFKIEVNGGQWLILKRLTLKHIGGNVSRKINRLHLEYDVLSHLYKSGIPVALPILSGDGKPYVTFGKELYCLSPYLISSPGIIKNASDRDMLYRNYGYAIARLHQAFLTYPDRDIASRTWRTDLISEVFDEAIPCIFENQSPEQHRVLAAMVSKIEPEMRISCSALPEQLIHRDCHPGNVLVDGFEVSGFVDCDHFSMGPRIFDLGYFLVHLIKRNVWDEREEAIWLNHYNQVIIGYETVHRLQKRERDALFYVMLAVLLMFAGHFYGHSERNAIPQRAKIELYAFRWMYRNRQEIISQINSLC